MKREKTIKFVRDAYGKIAQGQKGCCGSTCDSATSRKIGSADVGARCPRPDLQADILRPNLEKLFIPGKVTKAIFFTGKGGVGKTTISCITAMHTAQKGFKTLIVTTDPAAHIGEVLEKEIHDEPVENK